MRRSLSRDELLERYAQTILFSWHVHRQPVASRRGAVKSRGGEVSGRLNLPSRVFARTGRTEVVNRLSGSPFWHSNQVDSQPVQYDQACLSFGDASMY